MWTPPQTAWAPEPVTMRRVALITDLPGWHGAQLRRAFQAHGIDAPYLSLTACGVDLQHARHALRIPGFGRGLPDGVFVRGVPGGTLEQVILRLDVLHLLKSAGVPVYNDGRAIERSVDKAMTSVLLHRAGVPTPPTWVCEDRARARAVVLRETARGFELVLKPLFGSQGNGLRRIARIEDLPEAAPDYAGVYYLQRYIGAQEGEWRDWRVLVVNGRAIAAVLRQGTSWINNVAQGARCIAADPGDALRRLAEEATRAVDMDYAGVDLMIGPDGRAQVLEINSIPAWRGLQRVTGFNIAQALVDDFVTRHLARPLVATG